MIKKIRSIFAWKLQKDISGINLYWINELTGDRFVCPAYRGVTQPISWSFLERAQGKSWYYDEWGDKVYIKN